MYCLKLNLSARLLSKKIMPVALALLVTVACDSNSDAQRLSNLVTVANADYASVTLQDGAPVISTGEQTSFTLDAVTASATMVPVTVSGAIFSSSDNNVATVANNGTVTGISDGTVTITADYGNLIDTASVRVSSATLSSINIKAPGDSFTIDECDALQLSAEGIYAGEEGQPRSITNSVMWTVASETGAVFEPSVNSKGLLRARAEELLNVTAMLGSVSGSQQLTVLGNLDSIEIVADSGDLAAGSPLQYRAVPTYTTEAATTDITDNVNWTLSDNATTAFASVDNLLPAKGVVTPTRFGGGDLSVSCGDVTDTLIINTVGGGVIDQVRLDRESPLNIQWSGVQSIVQLRASAYAGDRLIRDVTEASDWEEVSTTTNLLQIDNDDGSKGELTIRGPGEIVVKATFTDEDNGDNIYVSPALTIVVE